MGSGDAARCGDVSSPRLGGADALGGAVFPVRSGDAGSARLGAADDFEEGAFDAIVLHPAAAAAASWCNYLRVGVALESVYVGPMRGAARVCRRVHRTPVSYRYTHKTADVCMCTHARAAVHVHTCTRRVACMPVRKKDVKMGTFD